MRRTTAAGRLAAAGRTEAVARPTRATRTTAAARAAATRATAPDARGGRRSDDDVDPPRTDTTHGEPDTTHGDVDHTHDAGGTAAELGAFRGDSRPSDQPDLTHTDLQRQIDDRAGTLSPDGVRRDG